MKDRKLWILVLLVAIALPLAGCDLFDDEDCDPSPDAAWIELLDGSVFLTRYSCEEAPFEGTPYCAVYQEIDNLTMDYLGNGVWEGRLAVPDDTLVVRGTFSGTEFAWDLFDSEAEVSGTWDFSSDGLSFEGDAFGDSAPIGTGTITCLFAGVRDADEPPFVADFGTCVD